MGFFSWLFGRHDEPDPPPPPERRPVVNPVDAILPKFPFTIQQIGGSMAVDRLEHLRRQGKRNGFTAILLGDSDSVQQLAVPACSNQMTPGQMLTEAASIDLAHWMKQRVESEDDEYFNVKDGPWPSAIQIPGSILAHLNMRNGKPKPRVFIASIPTPRSWEIAAHLRYGNWNECPPPAVHVAFARSWHERFGAEVVAVTPDTIEFEVPHPIADRAAAVALAREQFLYCPDIVHQGLETLNALAATLMKSRYWFFWWD